MQKMLCAILAVALLIGCTGSKDNDLNKQTFHFPADWLGQYEGTLELWNAKKGQHMQLPMYVEISKMEEPHHYRWYSKSTYKGREIVKDYTLYRTDSMPTNHYIIDENNGILLDRILLDDAFYDYFEVNGLGLYGISRRVKAGILFEIASFRLSSVSHSTYKSSDTKIDSVASYKVVNTQKVLLKKVKAK